MNKEQEKAWWCYGGSILSLIINMLLFVLKLWVGILTGSIAMIADAWHTLSDSLSSFVVFFGFWMSQKPADKDHPFGHGRAELIGAILISFILVMVGLEFLKTSIERFFSHEIVHYSTLSLSVFIIAVVVKEAMAQLTIWAGKRVDSTSLVADGWHHRSDAIATGVVIIGIFASRFYDRMDSILGILVSLIILYTAYEIFKESVKPILGEKPPETLVTAIKEIIVEKSLMMEDPHHFHYHRYGEHQEISFHLYVQSDVTLAVSHSWVDKLEKAILEELKVHATIHCDPK